MKIVRSILSVIVGMIAAFIGVMIVQMISWTIYGPAQSMDMNDTKAMQAYMDTMPPMAFALLLCSYGFGAFLGGLVAALITASRRILHAGIVGALFLIPIIVNFNRFKH